MNKNYNCMIAQSGGPTSAINASLSGIIYSAINNCNINKIYGALNGIQGILNNNIIDLTNLFQNNPNNINILKYTPSMFLGSCRLKLDSHTNENQYEMIFQVFKKYDIKYFFYIGGNDSMDTVMKLSQYAEKKSIPINIIGIPKTIDNDLFGTDHTPGFGSAAKFISTTLLEIVHDTYIYNMKSITIVEIMGRNAGWLTAASALARNEYNTSPDLIYLPEIPFSTYKFLNDIKNLFKKKKNIIIAVSEGLKDENDNYISKLAQTNNSTDSFGHSSLGGTGKTLEHLVKTAFSCKVRSIELNVLQRSAMHISSLTDINEAFELGKKALEFALAGVTDKMLTINRISNNPYKIKINYTDVANCANKEKKIPLEWINKEGNNVNDKMLEYLNPLIQGEPSLLFENGLPKYMDIKHLGTA